MDLLYLVVAVAAAPAGGPGLRHVVRDGVLAEGGGGGEGEGRLLLRLTPSQTPHLCRIRRPDSIYCTRCEILLGKIK